MLPENVDRILAQLEDSERVLDVGGWGAPFNRADWVLDLMPYESRGVMGSYGPEPERFSADTWVRRDFCDREPWPWQDDFFDFALCVTTLEDVRDPIWVCQELSRVAKRGYVEVPAIWLELTYNVQGPFLGHEHHRWLCEVEDGGLVFTHKPHSLHADWRVRVLPRWAARMRPEEQLEALFWERELRAREQITIGPYPRDRLAERVRERFRPPALELRAKALRERLRVARHHALRPLRAGLAWAGDRRRRGR